MIFEDLFNGLRDAQGFCVLIGSVNFDIYEKIAYNSKEVSEKIQDRNLWSNVNEYDRERS